MITIKGNRYSLGAFLAAGSSIFYYEVFRPIVWLPSRVLFGNFIGYWNNVLPLLQIGFQRMRSAKPEVSENVLHSAHDLRDNGFLMLSRKTAYGHLESIGMLSSIAKKCDELMNGYDGIFARVKGRIFNIYRPLERIPQLRHLITEQIDGIIRAYYQSSYKIKTVQVWRNQHIPHSDPQSDAGIANAFHNDGCRRTDLRLFVLLTDSVSRETGALRFHDRTATRRIATQLGYFSRSKQSRRVKQLLLDPATLRFFEGDIGDACLINTQECLHASSIPKAGSFRDVVQFEITPSIRPVPLEEIFSDMPEDAQVNPSAMKFKTP